MTTIPCNTQTRYIFSSGNVFQKIFPALKPDTDEIRFKARRVQIKMKAAARPRREVKTEFWSCIYQGLKVWLLWEDFSFCSVCFFVLWETDIAQLLMVTLSQYHSISQALRCFFYPRPYRCFKVSFVNRRCWPLFFYAAKAFLSPLLIAGRRITLSGTRFKRGPFTFRLISCFQAINRLFIHHT